MSKISYAELVGFLNSRYYLQESKSFTNKILKSYPEFTFEGMAYRCVVLRDGEKLSYQSKYFIHNSWSLSVDGILSFLDNCHREIDDIQDVYLFESYIKGLDLNKVINFLKAQGIRLSEEILQISKEEEILCLDYEELVSLDKQVLYEDKVSDLMLTLQSQVMNLINRQDFTQWELNEVIQGLEQAQFFIQNLGLSDHWNIEATIDFLKDQIKYLDASTLQNELIKIGFLISPK